MKLADLIYLYLDLYSYWQLNLRAALAAACCLARKENRADPSQTRSFAVVTNSGPGVEHVAVCNLRSRACSFLGMRRGLKDRGPRSMGAYNESRLRGAPVPSARRKSATVRMPTQPPSSPAAPVYGSNKIQSGEMVELHSGVKGMALSLENDNVGAVLFGGDNAVDTGLVGAAVRCADVQVGSIRHAIEVGVAHLCTVAECVARCR